MNGDVAACASSPMLLTRLTVLAAIQRPVRRFALQLHPCARDEEFMRLALREAKGAFDGGEVPIGAVLVRDGRVISVGRNRVEDLRDASAHAEMLCVRSAAAKLGGWRLSNTVSIPLRARNALVQS